ncbi:MAG: prephenate dehydrogenase [Firmicutes bacterium]|nr:prephenate dehydrogenase [Bacillota bacterium]
MNVGIVGLGLIGGSFAKAYSEKGHAVFATDIDRNILSFAAISGDICGELTKENIGQCDLVLICIYPEAAVSYMKEMAPFMGSRPVVIDCCGTKRKVFHSCLEIAREYGITYAGGHPMAGRQFSGYKYAKADLYHKAPMVIVPPDFGDIQLLGRIKTLLDPAGFGSISVTTAEKHDEMIAFTSQLAHVVSNAYVKSPRALSHSGFSAGSYKDMTRVAWLNPEMWAELFLENGDYLNEEIDFIIHSLEEYKKAIAEGDRSELIRLLREGKERKEEIDG